MRKILLFFFIACMMSCARNASVNNTVYSEKTKQEILLGKVDRSGLQNEPFKKWFDKSYSDYVVDQNVLDTLAGSVWKNVNITIVLATWCPDSRRELPRFLKIMDYVKFSETKIEYISVNREKTVPTMNLDYLEIKRVPTMIFFREGDEIGRIIESPDESLEKDIVKIMGI